MKQSVIELEKDTGVSEPAMASESLEEHMAGLEEITAGYEPPTGAGLNKRQAQLLLIEEMNKLIQTSNKLRLTVFRNQEQAWLEVGGIRPNPAIIAPGFNGRKHLSQAVFMARQRGGYKELLKAAGFK